jgi:hypothetical protein
MECISARCWIVSVLSGWSLAHAEGHAHYTQKYPIGINKSVRQGRELRTARLTIYMAALRGQADVKVRFAAGSLATQSDFSLQGFYILINTCSLARSDFLLYREV